MKTLKETRNAYRLNDLKYMESLEAERKRKALVGKLARALLVSIGVSFASYSIIGSSANVQEIQERAPAELASKSWKVMRYVGYTYGSFNHHGGTVYYQVQEASNPACNYQVGISIWEGELQYYYEGCKGLNFNALVNNGESNK